VAKYHISAIGDYNFADSKWEKFDSAEQKAMIDAGDLAGYDLVPKEIRFPDTARVGRSFDIESRWANVGSAPTYDDWQITYSLTDGAGSVVWSSASKISLGTILPDAAPLRVKDRYTIPKAVTPGSYSLEMRIVDPRNYRQPMQLCISQTPSPAGYLLGSVKIDP
jgi:hypothetical protein